MCIFNFAHKNYRSNIIVCLEYMFSPFSREVIPVELSYLLFLHIILPCNTWMSDHESTMAMDWIDLMVYAALNVSLFRLFVMLYL